MTPISAISSRRSLTVITALLVPYLIGMSAVVFFANHRLALGDDPSYEGDSAVPHIVHWFYAHNMARWDAGWYAQIAQQGYTKESTAFFPLYPLTVRVVQSAIPNFAVAASLVSLVAMIIALFLLLQWVYRQWGDEHVAVESIGWLLAMPTSFFFFASYTEGLFALLLVLILWLIERKSTIGAAIAAALLSLTRLVGLAAVVLFIGDWWRKREDPGALRQLLIRSVGSLAGLGIYAVFLFERFGDPLAFLSATTGWDRNTHVSPGAVVARWQRYVQEYAMVYDPANLAPIVARSIDLAFFVFACIMVVLVWQRWRKEYALWMAAMLAPAILSGTLLSMPRYVLPLVFIPVFLARFWKDGWGKRWFGIACVSLWTLLLTMFSVGYWVG